MLAFHSIPSLAVKGQCKRASAQGARDVWGEGCFIRRLNVGGKDRDGPAAGAQPPRVEPQHFQSHMLLHLLGCHLPYTQVAVTRLPPPSSPQQTSARSLSQTGAGQVVTGNVFFQAFLWMCPRLTSSVRFSIDLLFHSVSLAEMNSVLHIEQRRAIST